MSLWRSWQFIPGNQERKLAKAITSDADVIIYDLEDAVPIQEKEQARTLVKQAIAEVHGKKIFVRINDASSPYFMDDIQEMAACGVTGILLPKAGNKEQIHLTDYLLGMAEEKSGHKRGGTEIVPIIESAAGLHYAFDIATASHRVHCMAFGSVDYTLDINSTLTKEGTEILFARCQLVNVSRAAGIEPPIDGVYVDIQDDEGLRQETTFIKQLGFQGKLTIHPKQNEIVNAVFAPTDEDIIQAERIVRAFDKALTEGSAAIQVDGKMVDYPVAIRARKIMEQAEVLGLLKSGDMYA